MSESALILSPKKFYFEAKKMLEKKDFVEFLSKISIAIEAAQNDKEMLAKTWFLKAKGLIAFNHHRKALKCIDNALKYNVGKQALELKKDKGIAKGFLGEIDEAIKIFKQLTTESDDLNILTSTYINISWAYFTLANNFSKEAVAEVKFYLDKTKEYFDCLSNRLKWRVRNAYSVYYFCLKDYEKAINILEDSIQFCEEEDLADIYNNLAELYIMLDEDGTVCEIAKEYLEKAEILATKYNNNLGLGYIFYTKATIQLREDQLFTALDSLYLAIKFFKDAEAPIKVGDVLSKINEVMKKTGQLLANINKIEPGNYREILSQTRSLKRKGLLNFNRVLERLIDENDLEVIDLKIYQGIVYGNLGKLDKAVQTFKSVIDQTEDNSIITIAYLNIAWLYLVSESKTTEENLPQAKKYLELAKGKFEIVSKKLKYDILTTYSAFYSLHKEYDEAIEVLIDSINYCTEENLSDLYNNLAELYLKSSNDTCLSEIIKEYLEKAEVLATKHSKLISLGQTFYLRAEIESREDQFFSALDTLYLAFSYFKRAEATILAYECLLKINQQMDNYKQNSLLTLKNKLT